MPVLISTILKSRAGRYALLFLALVASMYGLYRYGYTNGQNALKDTMSKQYAEALEKSIAEATKKQKELHQIEIDYLKKQSEIKEAKDKTKKVIEKIVINNPKMTDEVISKDELESFNASLLELRKVRQK